MVNGIKIIQIDQYPNYYSTPYLCWSSFIYCYQSVIGISLYLSQVDPIRWFPLYLVLNNFLKTSKLFSYLVSKPSSDFLKAKSFFWFVSQGLFRDKSSSLLKTGCILASVVENLLVIALRATSRTIISKGTGSSPMSRCSSSGVEDLTRYFAHS